MTDAAPSSAELQALACGHCPAQAMVRRGQGVAGPVLTVFVVHDDDCPWSRVHIPFGGATLIGQNAILRHVRASDPDVSE